MGSLVGTVIAGSTVYLNISFRFSMLIKTYTKSVRFYHNTYFVVLTCLHTICTNIILATF